MPLVERWNRVEQGLDPRWTEVTLSLAIKDGAARSRAAALLGPAQPGVGATLIRFNVSTQGTSIGPEAARRLLRRIDQEGIVGRLELVGARGVRPEPEEPEPARSLAAEWQEALEVLPSDWSDLLAELELHSSADVDRGRRALRSHQPHAVDGPTGLRLPLREPAAATAPPPGWSAAASPGSTRPGSPATSGSRGR